MKFLARLLPLVLVLVLCGAHAAEKKDAAAGLEIRFRTEKAGIVLLNIYRPDGVLARRLVQAQRFPAGAHKVVWDGRAEDGAVVEPGDYTWRGLVHEGIGLKVRGWVANGSAPPDGKGGWGGDAGVPNAVAADERWVYLGWSLAEEGKALLACDLEGRVQWGHRRAEGASGCKVLAVDDGVVHVLGGLAGNGADGGTIYKLAAKDGQPIPWPSGALDLKITSFWPADGKTKPDTADSMAVRHGHIYLTFTSSEFLAVLDAKTGAYLQTVVGAPPGMIDVVATQTDLPDAPGKLVDADFAVVSLGGGVLGKVLFAHDPLWVVTSELTPMEREVTITALSVMGDKAKFHRHEAFVGLGAPFHQVQARPLLDTEGYVWIAGRPGGRPLLGPWQSDALRGIRGVALAADGKLWVAEGDAFPKRFSVWDTSAQQGRLVREYFGPAERNAPGSAINPLDPDVMFAQGCEWRIDRKTGQATCLGVVMRENVEIARYGVGENGHAYLVTTTNRSSGAVRIFERVGDGDYKLRAGIFPVNAQGEAATWAEAAQAKFWADENGDGEAQEGETQLINQPPVFHVERTTQDLTLSTGTAGRSYLLRVVNWSACGAPKYNATRRIALPQGGQVSADGRLLLSSFGDTVCRELPSGKELWKLSGADRTAGLMGSARLPAPMNNVWLEASAGRCRLLNEDGFELASFSEVDTLIATPREASLTQAADGRLYLQTSRSAYGNFEVTGLDNLRALSAGKIRVPAR